MLSYQRYAVLTCVALLTIASFIGAVFYSEWLLIITAVSSSLLGLGVYDIFQSKHAILRNYPIIGHMRFILESIRPELRQYIIEGDRDEEPFSREIRPLYFLRLGYRFTHVSGNRKAVSRCNGEIGSGNTHGPEKPKIRY